MTGVFTVGGFIDGLNKNAGAVQAVFAGVVALATLIYVALTGGMWREMRLTNRRMVRPNVQVVFGHGPNAWPDYRVSVENIGNVPVYDVRITADPPDLALFHLGPPFGTAIPVLAERVKLETCLPVYVGDFDKIPDGTRLTFTATYQLADGKPAPVQRFSYDMDLYKRLLSPRVQNDTFRHLERIAEATEAMAGLNLRLAKLEADAERARRALDSNTFY